MIEKNDFWNCKVEKEISEDTRYTYEHNHICASSTCSQYVPSEQ